MKSFVFCTSFFESEDHYDTRISRWVNYYKSLEFTKDKPLVIIDDGSPDISFCDKEFNIIDPDNPPEKLERINFIRFPNHLGRFSHLAYFGWWRSFLYSFKVAEKYKFDKIIHVESDCYLLTSKITNYIENSNKGWATFWTKKYSFPETNIQVINKDMFHAHPKIEEKLNREKKKSFGFLAGFHAEHVLPFTNIEKNFTGDRYGEEGLPQKPEYDYYCQTPPHVPLEFDLEK